MYTCCQISEWADEQWLAWSSAAHENANYSYGLDNGGSGDGTEPVLVPRPVSSTPSPVVQRP
jgi:hypothetical protein